MDGSWQKPRKQRPISISAEFGGRRRRPPVSKAGVRREPTRSRPVAAGRLAPLHPRIAGGGGRCAEDARGRWGRSVPACTYPGDGVWPVGGAASRRSRYHRANPLADTALEHHTGLIEARWTCKQPHREVEEEPSLATSSTAARAACTPRSDGDGRHGFLRHLRLAERCHRGRGERKCAAAFRSDHDRRGCPMWARRPPRCSLGLLFT